MFLKKLLFYSLNSVSVRERVNVCSSTRITPSLLFSLLCDERELMLFFT